MSQLDWRGHVSGEFLYIAVGLSRRTLLPAPIVVVLRVQKPIGLLVKNGFFGVSRVPLFLDGLNVPALAQDDWIALVEGFLLHDFLLDSNGPMLIALCLFGLTFSDCGLDAVQSGIVDVDR